MGVGEQLYLVVDQTNRLFTANQGVLFTPLFQWTERVIYGTPLDLTIDPGASGGPRVAITHPLTRPGPQEACRRRSGRSGGGDFGWRGVAGPWAGPEGLPTFSTFSTSKAALCDDPLELGGEQYTVGKHFSNSFQRPWLKIITVKGGQTKHERSITSERG